MALHKFQGSKPLFTSEVEALMFKWTQMKQAPKNTCDTCLIKPTHWSVMDRQVETEMIPLGQQATENNKRHTFGVC